MKFSEDAREAAGWVVDYGLRLQHAGTRIDKDSYEEVLQRIALVKRLHRYARRWAMRVTMGGPKAAAELETAAQQLNVMKITQNYYGEEWMEDHWAAARCRAAAAACSQGVAGRMAAATEWAVLWLQRKWRLRLARKIAHWHVSDDGQAVRAMARLTWIAWRQMRRAGGWRALAASNASRIRARKKARAKLQAAEMECFLTKGTLSGAAYRTDQVGHRVDLTESELSRRKRGRGVRGQVEAARFSSGKAPRKDGRWRVDEVLDVCWTASGALKALVRWIGVDPSTQEPWADEWTYALRLDEDSCEAAFEQARGLPGDPALRKERTRRRTQKAAAKATANARPEGARRTPRVAEREAAERAAPGGVAGLPAGAQAAQGSVRAEPGGYELHRQGEARRRGAELLVGG